MVHPVNSLKRLQLNSLKRLLSSNRSATKQPNTKHGTKDWNARYFNLTWSLYLGWHAAPCFSKTSTHGWWPRELASCSGTQPEPQQRSCGFDPRYFIRILHASGWLLRQASCEERGAQVELRERRYSPSVCNSWITRVWKEPLKQFHWLNKPVPQLHPNNSAIPKQPRVVAAQDACNGFQ